MTQPAVLENELAPIFTTKAPFQLPEEAKDLIVKIMPYIAVVLLPLSILAILFGGGLALLSFFTLHLGASLALIIMIIAIVVGLMAIPGLFSRSRDGWSKTYLSQLIWIVSMLVEFHILSAVISFLLGMYLLFQIRDRYVN
ncbi:chromate transporter [Fibrella aquatilis]|uniref:Chromate transporter n=1 Tax=Fibrella aquatilis TaxID=2817059 RepID=A0A939JY04_9BACT|nr:chromate transporter [Fibrella aquatilis]MBO0929843.1 chromate transporter [Fibrella aquatilis]